MLMWYDARMTAFMLIDNSTDPMAAISRFKDVHVFFLWIWSSSLEVEKDEDVEGWK